MASPPLSRASSSMPALRNPNLRLLPELAAGIVYQAESRCLPLAVLVGILVHNDSIRPVPVTALPPGKFSRARLSCSMRPLLLTIADHSAKRNQINRNAYLEALIARFLQQQGPLVVLAKSSQKS